jgi:recombination protein RecT
MNATAPAVRQDEPSAMVQLKKQLEQRAEEFRMVLPSHISPERFQRTLLTAVQLNPDLLTCDRRSFLTACMKAAQDGLLPDGREAAVVVFKTRTKDAERGWIEVRLAQYLPMVFGLRKKILQSAEVSDLFAAVVYRQEIAGGFFHYEEGSERTLRHRPIIDPDFAPTDADIALAYSVATFSDGTKSFEVMRRGELDRVREASQTGARFDAKGNPREPKGPWVQWFPEMAKKTVIRRHSKSLPQSGDVIVRDVESEDMGLAAAKATVALLDSRQSEPPRQLADKPEPAPAYSFDPTTGELIDKPDEPDAGPEYIEPELNPTPADAAAAEEPEPETKRRGRPPKAREPEPETNFDPEPEPSDFDEREPEPERDELGVTRDDDESLALHYVDRARACETVIDLNALEKEAAMDLALMAHSAPESAANVDTEFARARKRLTPPAKDKAS